MSVGKSVRLFLVDGTPGGLLTAEIMNWTGHVVAAPRSDLSVLLKRPEASRTGIYILLGDDPESLGGTLAYIGEGDNVGRRLYEHSRSESQRGKDFWDRAIVLTSKDANLTKAHARYLESRLIQLATLAKRAQLVNGTAPAELPLPEADRSDMEYFIEQAKIVLPVLGINLFRAKAVRNTTDVPTGGLTKQTEQSAPIFELSSVKYGYSSKAQEIDGEFTVLEGSTARESWMGGADGYAQLRHTLEQEGALTVDHLSNLAVFSQDQVFASPSAAAAIVTGRATNGRTAWKDPSTGMSLGEWQNREIDEGLIGE